MQRTVSNGLADFFGALAAGLTPNPLAIIEAELAGARKQGIEADTAFRRAITQPTVDQLAAQTGLLGAQTGLTHAQTGQVNEAARAARMANDATARLQDILSGPALDWSDPAVRQSIVGAAAGHGLAGLQAAPAFALGAGAVTDPMALGSDEEFSRMLMGTGVQPNFGATPHGAAMAASRGAGQGNPPTLDPYSPLDASRLAPLIREAIADRTGVTPDAVDADTFIKTHSVVEAIRRQHFEVTGQELDLGHAINQALDILGFEGSPGWPWPFSVFKRPSLTPIDDDRLAAILGGLGVPPYAPGPAGGGGSGGAAPAPREGDIYQLPDGSRVVVRNGQLVPYSP